MEFILFPEKIFQEYYFLICKFIIIYIFKIFLNQKKKIIQKIA